MTADESMQMLKRANVIRNGHFLLTSGRHTGEVVQCARLFENAEQTDQLYRHILQKASFGRIDAVLGPAVGGIIPSYAVSAILNVRNIFCEREAGLMKLRRGFQIHSGERILIADDVITTGGSLREVAALIRAEGGSVAGAVAVADLSGGKYSIGIPVNCAVNIHAVSYEEEECPYCANGQPLERIASRSF